MFSSTGKGSNQLILQGAKIYLNPSQLLDNNISIINPNNPHISFTTNQSTSNLVNNKLKPINPIELSPLEKKIVHCVKDKYKTIEEISIETNINQYELIGLLSVMELEGKIKVISGGRYISNTIEFALRYNRKNI